MRYNVTFSSDGRPIAQTFHVPFNLARFPYVPHPAQLAGMIPMGNVSNNRAPVAGFGMSTAVMRSLNGG